MCRCIIVTSKLRQAVVSISVQSTPCSMQRAACRTCFGGIIVGFSAACHRYDRMSGQGDSRAHCCECRASRASAYAELCVGNVCSMQSCCECTFTHTSHRLAHHIQMHVHAPSPQPLRTAAHCVHSRAQCGTEDAPPVEQSCDELDGRRRVRVAEARVPEHKVPHD